MRIVKDPEERKEEIIKGSIKVFADKGYEKTSISDIAKEIGISQGLCYRYFKSKEEIYDAALDEYASYIVEQNIKNTLTKNMTLKELIKVMCSNYNFYCNTEKGLPDYYELFHKKENKKLHNDLSLKITEKLIPYMTKVLEESKQRGEINISDCEAYARFLQYGQLGILMNDILKGVDKEKTAQKIEACSLGLLNL